MMGRLDIASPDITRENTRALAYCAFAGGGQGGAPMQVILTAVGPDNRGLADPIVHHVSSAGANIAEIQMYDHDAERIFAMLVRMDWPVDSVPLSELRERMNVIGRDKRLSIRTW